MCLGFFYLFDFKSCDDVVNIESHTNNLRNKVNKTTNDKIIVILFNSTKNF